ncbi:MAG: hypothetical protein Kow00109_04770 [Acidobacteriota bacterium]
MSPAMGAAMTREARDPVARIERRGWCLGVGLAAVAAVFRGPWEALGLLFGLAVSGVGFRWLRHVVDVLLVEPQALRPGRLAVTLVLRLILICLGGFAIIQASYTSGLAVLTGMACFVLAGMAEAVRLLLVGRGR